MKPYIKKIASVFLASIVFFSTMSFSMKIHHCFNKGPDTSTYEKTMICDLENDLSATSKCDLIDDNNCCSTNLIVKKADNDLKKTSFNNYSETIVFLYTYLIQYEGLEGKLTPFLNYHAPLIFKDYQVTNQTFLI